MMTTDLTYHCLEPFYFSKLRVVVQAEEILYLPDFKGSTLHGAFGRSLKKVVCPFQHKKCNSDCLVFNSGHCLYQYIFETRVPGTEKISSNQIVRNKNGRQPAPLVISLLDDKRTEYKAGEKLVFDILLIGKAVEYASHIIYALDVMCKTGIGKRKGRCLLKSVSAFDKQGNQHPVYSLETATLKNLSHIVSLKDLADSFPCPDKVTSTTLQFHTRLEIKIKGKSPEINFDILFRRLFARVITLARLHCGIDCSSIDVTKISRSAKVIETVASSFSYEYARRYSSRQNRRTPFGGYTGKIAFRGDLKPFWPILLLGEKVHVGKKTSFGFGSYTIKTSCEDIFVSGHGTSVR